MDWYVDRHFCAKVDRSDNEGVDSDAGVEVGSGYGEGV